MRSKWGLPVIILIGFVFLLGSALALVELGTSKTTVCRSARLTTFHRITGPVCTTTGGTSPVVYVILVVAIVIGVICLAAGITVLAVRISAPEPSGGSWQAGQSLGYAGPTASGPMGAGGLSAQGTTAESGATFDPGVGGTAEAGSLPPFSGAQDVGAAPVGSPPPGWYEVAPGGPKRWWDGSQWLLTRSPPTE